MGKKKKKKSKQTPVTVAATAIITILVFGWVYYKVFFVWNPID